MPLPLPDPFVGGPLAEQIDSDPKKQAKQLEERFDSIQRNFDALKLTFPLGSEHLQGSHKTAFPFGANWGNYGGAYEDATYSKVGRVVYLQGLVTKSGTPAANNVIGTLPTGYRPTEILQFTVKTGSTDAFGVVEVQPDGDVAWITGATAETDNTSLSGISFIVD